MYAKAKVNIKRYGVHACVISHYREDVNAPASAENAVFRTFAETHENA
jgi:hypothetical protein